MAVSARPENSKKLIFKKMSDPADIACEVLELIKSSSTSKMSSSEETILVKRVWSVLCSQPNTDTESRLQVRIFVHPNRELNFGVAQLWCALGTIYSGIISKRQIGIKESNFGNSRSSF